MTNIDNDEIIQYHKSRIAFLIINDKVLYLKDSPMSHREWFDTLNLDLCFDNITRGYVLDNRIVFYKGDHGFDDETIAIANKFYKNIEQELNLKNSEVWCGQQKKDTIKPITDPWPPIKRIK